MRPKIPDTLWAICRGLHQRGWKRTARAVKTFNWLINKCLLPSEAIVGKNVQLEHYALGIVIHPQTTIGDNCRIFHMVTMAAESPIGSDSRIIIGNNVIIGVGAIIVARHGEDLTIGDNCLLGAGSVLTKNIPPYQVWAGNPAHKIKDIPRP